MTAAIYDLTASPHFHLTRRPPRTQGYVVPVSLINRQVLEYWHAAMTVRFERRHYASSIFGRPIWAESDLWRLRLSGVLPGLKNRAREVLQEEDAYARPFGGGAA